jgi:hypothetical protein
LRSIRDLDASIDSGNGFAPLSPDPVDGDGEEHAVAAIPVQTATNIQDWHCKIAIASMRA